MRAGAMELRLADSEGVEAGKELPNTALGEGSQHGQWCGASLGPLDF